VSPTIDTLYRGLIEETYFDGSAQRQSRETGQYQNWCISDSSSGNTSRYLLTLKSWNREGHRRWLFEVELLATTPHLDCRDCDSG